MRELHTEIEINATPERVWQLLIDFDRYPHWNPFIRSIKGRPEPETKLDLFIQPLGTRGMLFRPAVLKAEPYRELRWLGRVLIPGLFDGEHIFIIERVAENRVRFIQRELFRGLLVPLLWRRLNTRIRRSFNEMNAAFEKLAEDVKA